MERNKGRRGVDKSAGAALGVDSALADIVAEFASNELRPGEFTTQQVFDALNGLITMNAVNCRLKKTVADGRLTKRKIKLNGHVVNAYRRVSADKI